MEVTDDEDDVVPMAPRPSKNFDIVQGTVAGSEFDKLKRDSAPLEEPET